jgi:L-seryl-tRNA(Ser) seleniumtransferase
MDNRKELLRRIPKIDEMLTSGQLVFLLEEHPRAVVVEELRKVTDEIRQAILAGELDYVPSVEEILDKVELTVTQEDQYSLRRVINATGVVLHTNLGRANLSKKTVEHLSEIAGHYSTCEYDLKKGARGSRHDHVEHLIKQITGAEAAMIVNNNAAATMIVLAALAKDKEVVVSRGELVEIGGSFRIPEIMEQSGAILKEVGSTNKTHEKDYINAYNEERTAAFMKVHTSNYRMLALPRKWNCRKW